MKVEAACFIMICTDGTEQECVTKGLFGDREWRLPFLRSIKSGDLGFLLNVSSNQLLGIFVATGPASKNIDATAWGGSFPAQVPVKLVGELQRVANASEKLSNLIHLRDIPKQPRPYKVPYQNTHGPDITEKLLALFDRAKTPPPNELKQPKEIGVVPETTLEDVAGLADVKTFIHQRILAPFEDEETAYALNLRIGGGMLLFGPPGTGKTLLAMSVAKYSQSKFVDISPSIIIGFPGEAEKRIESIFAALENEPRAVVFLDEAEWILCKRDDQTSSVMQRVTPVLLAQLTRLFKQRTRPIIVIAATNKPEMIDPAFLRPGRFDKLFFVGLPDKSARTEILNLQLKNRRHEIDEKQLRELAQELEGYSGADIENIIEEAAFAAFSRRANGRATITQDDVLQVISKTSKSVTETDIQRYTRFANDRGLLT